MQVGFERRDAFLLCCPTSTDSEGVRCLMSAPSFQHRVVRYFPCGGAKVLDPDQRHLARAHASHITFMVAATKSESKREMQPWALSPQTRVSVACPTPLLPNDASGAETEKARRKLPPLLWQGISSPGNQAAHIHPHRKPTRKENPTPLTQHSSRNVYNTPKQNSADGV